VALATTIACRLLDGSVSFVPIGSTSHLYRTSIAPLSHLYRTSIAPLSHLCRTSIAPLSHLYRTSQGADDLQSDEGEGKEEDGIVEEAYRGSKPKPSGRVGTTTRAMLRMGALAGLLLWVGVRMHVNMMCPALTDRLPVDWLV
jgi:hypothetical protein